MRLNRLIKITLTYIYISIYIILSHIFSIIEKVNYLVIRYMLICYRLNQKVDKYNLLQMTIGIKYSQHTEYEFLSRNTQFNIKIYDEGKVSMAVCSNSIENDAKRMGRVSKLP